MTHRVGGSVVDVAMGKSRVDAMRIGTIALGKVSHHREGCTRREGARPSEGCNITEANENQGGSISLPRLRPTSLAQRV